MRLQPWGFPLTLATRALLRGVGAGRRQDESRRVDVSVFLVDNDNAPLTFRCICSLRKRLGAD
jgi:hypothetical protein